MPLNLSILEDFERNSEHLEIDSAGKNIVQPWLIVHGEADPGVSVEQAFELHRQNKNSKLLLIPEGDHVFGARHPWNEPQLPEKLRQVCDATIDFFLSN